jgi:hypothetical protein
MANYMTGFENLMSFGSMFNMPEKALFIKASRWDYMYTHGPNYIQKENGLMSQPLSFMCRNISEPVK